MLQARITIRTLESRRSLTLAAASAVKPPSFAIPLVAQTPLYTLLGISALAVLQIRVRVNRRQCVHEFCLRARRMIGKTYSGDGIAGAELSDRSRSLCRRHKLFNASANRDIINALQW